MVGIIRTPLLEKIPIDIPLRASFSYFLGNAIIVWKLLIKTQKSSFFRNCTQKYSKIHTVQVAYHGDFPILVKNNIRCLIG